MANPILTYLPPGWTEDKLKNATDEDYEALIDPAQQNLTNLLDHVEQSDLGIFGFVLFRTYYSRDEQS
jgi:hypothetical protein